MASVLTTFDDALKHVASVEGIRIDSAADSLLISKTQMPTLSPLERGHLSFQLREIQKKLFSYFKELDQAVLGAIAFHASAYEAMHSDFPTVHLSLVDQEEHFLLKAKLPGYTLRFNLNCMRPDVLVAKALEELQSVSELVKGLCTQLITKAVAQGLHKLSKDLAKLVPIELGRWFTYQRKGHHLLTPDARAIGYMGALFLSIQRAYRNTPTETYRRLFEAQKKHFDDAIAFLEKGSPKKRLPLLN